MSIDSKKINNIVVFCQYAQEPPYNTMLRYHNWGKELVNRGYSVTIVGASTVHNTTQDMIDILKNDKSVKDGVNYVYIKTPQYVGNSIKRIINMHAYCSGIKKLKKSLNLDLCIVCEAYVFAYAKKAFKNIPIITDIVDLWPQSIIEYANKSKNNPLIKYLYLVEKKAYIKSDALIFSMEGGIDYVKERKYVNKVDLNKIFHINMGIDLKQCDENMIKYKSELPWNTKDFNIGYCGSIRQANNVKQICDVALEMQNKGYKDIQFQIYGNGDELEFLKEYCLSSKIDNIHFYGRIEKEKIPFILSNMKANILTYKQVNLMKYGGSQSKLFDYLATGRPIICNAKFGYNLITRYNCGLVTDSQETTDFTNCIEKFHSMDVNQIEKMGKRARQVAEKYDQPVLVDKLEELFRYIEKKQ